MDNVEKAFLGWLGGMIERINNGALDEYSKGYRDALTTTRETWDLFNDRLKKHKIDTGE
jgi:hypothetical protein